MRFMSNRGVVKAASANRTPKDRSHQEGMLQDAGTAVKNSMLPISKPQEAVTSEMQIERLTAADGMAHKGEGAKISTKKFRF